MAQTSTIQVSCVSDLSSALDLVTANVPLKYKKTFTLANGTGANSAENVFHDQRTLAASANEDLDLSGSLTNAYGTSLTFTKIKTIIVYAATGNTNNVQMSVPATNGFSTWALAASDGLKIRPGGLVCLVAPDATGYAVTAGTGDLLNFANSGAGTSVTYDVIFIGETS